MSAPGSCNGVSMPSFLGKVGVCVPNFIVEEAGSNG